MRILAYLIVACVVGLLTHCAHSVVSDGPPQRVFESNAPLRHVPSIRLLETEHDFGKISDKGIAAHDFKIRNTGTAPLEIESVQHV